MTEGIHIIFDIESSDVNRDYLSNLIMKNRETLPSNIKLNYYFEESVAEPTEIFKFAITIIEPYVENIPQLIVDFFLVLGLNKIHAKLRHRKNQTSNFTKQELTDIITDAIKDARDEERIRNKMLDKEDSK